MHKKTLTVLFLSAFLVPALLAFDSKAQESPLQGLFKDNFILLPEPLPGPATPVKDLSGKDVTFSDFHGELVLLNFWATWCAPCVAEMPSLERLQIHFEGQPFRVLAVSLDRQGTQKVLPFLKRLGLERLQILLDPRGHLSREVVVSGLPTTYLINQDGQILGGLLGPAEWDSEDAIALIEYYLKTPEAVQEAESGDEEAKKGS